MRRHSRSAPWKLGSGGSGDAEDLPRETVVGSLMEWPWVTFDPDSELVRMNMAKPEPV